MTTLIRLRWMLLVAALFCPLTGALLLFAQGMLSPLGISLWWSAPVLQAAGTFAMSRRFGIQRAQDDWAVAVGYLAAAAWLIALLTMVIESGFLDFSNLFRGLQAMALGVLMQIATLIGFASRRA